MGCDNYYPDYFSMSSQQWRKFREIRIRMQIYSSMEIFGFSNSPSSQISVTAAVSDFAVAAKRTLMFAVSPLTAALLWILLILISPAAAADGISYADHCRGVLLDQPLLPNPNPPLLSQNFLFLRNAHVDYGASSGSKGADVVHRSLSFSTRELYRTQNDAVFKVEAGLRLNGLGFYTNFTRRELRLVNFRPPRIPVASGDRWSSISLVMSGFWDSISGKLCMVGSGYGKFSSDHFVLKLDYLNVSSIFTSLVNGTLEKLDSDNHSSNLMWILGVNLRNYKYELIDKEVDGGAFSSLEDLKNVSLGVEDLGQNMCPYLITSGIVKLKYRNDCSNVNCNFLGKGNGNYTPSIMYFNQIECSNDGRVRFLLGFGDHGRGGYQMPFDPNTTLVSEGKWDAKKRRLDMVACRIFSDWDEGLVGECLIQLSLRFPALWTLRDRSSVVGEMWSSRSVNESGYFGTVVLESVKNKNVRSARLRYEYSAVENSSRACANKNTKRKKGGKYPDVLSSDMRFDMIVSNRKVNLWGYSSPLFVESKPYQLPMVLVRESDTTWHGKQNLSNVVNVSYILSLASSDDFKLSSEYMQIKSFEISAEGRYNSENGHLCMTGCMQVDPPKVRVRRNASLDCAVLVDIQYPPLHSRSEGSVKGTIRSTREKSDPLYFEPFEIFSRSVYAGQAEESLWRMDLEITMVLISTTLSCIFMGLQILHVKRHSDVLPLISFAMLLLLTLGHLVPLLLNFEALFLKSRNNLNVYFGSDGWLEVNEVLVRVITMIAFLLEFRLLQLSWSARSGDQSQTKFWISDKKVLYLSVPMYITGALVSWFVHLSRKSNQIPHLRINHNGYNQQSLWGNLKSYAGLILDGFLLPQVLFNLFSDSKEKTLAPSFYAGTTLVRLLPHAYDLYRSHTSSWSFTYIYANPRLDYYSTTWDIVISIGGLVFAILIYLQQRYGGRFLLPKRFHLVSAYEKVPVGSSSP